MTDAFLIAPCSNCAEDVLLAYDLLEGELITRCIHCDLQIARSTASEATGAEVAALGYSVPGESAEGGERGCRDGQCGVRQPEP